MPNPLHSNPLLFAIAVLPNKQANSFVKYATKHGLQGGLVALADGLIDSELLNLFSIRSQAKDLVIMFERESVLIPVLKDLTERFHLNKPNHGIIFCMDVNVAVSKYFDYSENDFSKLTSDHELIWLTFKHGIHEEISQNIRQSSLTGATFFTGRSEYPAERNSYLGLSIAPQRETMLSVVKTELVKDVFDALEAKYHIENTLGMKLFSMSVTAFSMADEPHHMNPTDAEYSILFSIISSDLVEPYTDMMKELKMSGGTKLSAYGTMSPEAMKKYFAIEASPRKALLFTIDKTEKIKQAYQYILDDPVMMAPHQSCYFTMPINRIEGLYQANED